MTVRLRLFALGAIAVAAAACPDVPVAPIVTPPTPARYVTFTLDTINGFNVDVTNQWDGITLLVGADQSVHVVAFDGWSGRLRYHGCANVCNDRVHWFHGTADSASVGYGEWEPGSGVALTPQGFQAVYAWEAGYGPAIRYAHCPGACNFTGHWTATTPLSTPGSVQDWTGHSTPLAADAAGGLHLLFYGPGDRTLHYGFCAAACDTPANWQDVPITGPYGYSRWSRLIAVAPGGGVHVLYGTAVGLIHATCSGGCTNAANWQSGPVAGAYFLSLDALAMAFGPEGRLHLAYTDQTGVVSYATCAAPCTASGTWSTASLPLTTRDVSLATDAQGQLFLATNSPTVAVSRCAASCLSSASWQTVTVDSALGYGRVSIAVDAAGHARIASTYGGFTQAPQILQYTQMLQ